MASGMTIAVDRGGGQDGGEAGGGETVDGERDDERDGNRDDEVATRLQVVVIAEEGEVAGDPEKQRGDERVGEEARAQEEGEGEDGEEEGVEDTTDPKSVGKGVEDYGGKRGEFEAGVAVGGEEVAVVLYIAVGEEGCR